MVEPDESIVRIVCGQHTAEVRLSRQSIGYGFHSVNCVDIRQDNRIIKMRLARSLEVIVGIEKSLVFLDWPANGTAELILPQHVGSACLQKVDGVQLVVPEILVEGAMPVVCAAPRNDVHDPCRSTSKFRRVVGIDDAEFLH